MDPALSKYIYIYIYIYIERERERERGRERRLGGGIHGTLLNRRIVNCALKVFEERFGDRFESL